MTSFSVTWTRSALAALFVFMSFASASHAQQTFSVGQLQISGSDGLTHNFTVELALTASQRQQGLMYREKMALDHGMLFDFGKTEEVMMWMKNTPLPLDMIFMGKDGVITHIHENAVPYSSTIISSDGPVRFVLEVNGGVTRKLGIKEGDRVTSPAVEAAR